MSTPSTSAATYTHGHASAVLSAHSWRSAANSSAYLLPSLQPGFAVLDVGCGPGTITVDLAKIVSKGRVVGMDSSEEVVVKARAHAKDRGVGNVEFEVGDVFNLKYQDGEFDVVHAHQLLQHIHDPVAALKEIRRVTKPGGIIAVRECDYSMMTWYPLSPLLNKWHSLYSLVARSNQGEPDAGRRLLSWSLAAGFNRSQVTCSVGSWCYSTQSEVEWWGGLWAERTREGGSGFGKGAVAKGFARPEELEEISEAWKRWSREEDAWFAVPSGEVLIRV